MSCLVSNPTSIHAGTGTPVLSVSKKQAKAAKDALQCLRLHERTRKAEPTDSGTRIALPLSAEAAVLLESWASSMPGPDAQVTCDTPSNSNTITSKVGHRGQRSAPPTPAASTDGQVTNDSDGLVASLAENSTPAAAATSKLTSTPIEVNNTKMEGEEASCNTQGGTYADPQPEAAAGLNCVSEVGLHGEPAPQSHATSGVSGSQDGPSSISLRQSNPEQASSASMLSSTRQNYSIHESLDQTPSRTNRNALSNGHARTELGSDGLVSSDMDQNPPQTNRNVLANGHAHSELRDDSLASSAKDHVDSGGASCTDMAPSKAVKRRQDEPSREDAQAVLRGLLRSGVARLEWRELLVTQRAGGASPAAKLRAGMQQLLFAHGLFLLLP